MLILTIKTIHWLFGLYTLMLAVRIIGSWFPAFSAHQIMRFLRFYTDPYLNLFRRFIPPIGGALDLSPILAFFGLQILEKFLLFLLI
ncbi:MAG TPA: YggT family protein [Rhabdochlamydiaceae bacterium]|jgi:YggT family protein